MDDQLTSALCGAGQESAVDLVEKITEGLVESYRTTLMILFKEIHQSLVVEKLDYTGISWEELCDELCIEKEDRKFLYCWLLNYLKYQCFEVEKIESGDIRIKLPL